MNFPPEGSNHPPNITPPHRLEHAFKFKDYSPDVFRKIRRHFGIGEPGRVKRATDVADEL